MSEQLPEHLAVTDDIFVADLVDQSLLSDEPLVLNPGKKRLRPASVTQTSDESLGMDPYHTSDPYSGTPYTTTGYTTSYTTAGGYGDPYNSSSHAGTSSSHHAQQAYAAPPPSSSSHSSSKHHGSSHHSGSKRSRTNTPWTAVEEQRLRQLRDAGQSWAEIGKSFPNRTEGSVKKHWYKDMHYAEFAEDESQALLNAIKEYDNNKWKVIGQKVGKPAKACEQYARENFGSYYATGGGSSSGFGSGSR